MVCTSCKYTYDTKIYSTVQSLREQRAITPHCNVMHIMHKICVLLCDTKQLCLLYINQHQMYTLSYNSVKFLSYSTAGKCNTSMVVISFSK